MSTNELKRGCFAEGKKFKDVIFIGNGAIENGSKPLNRWMYEESNEQQSI